MSASSQFRRPRRISWRPATSLIAAVALLLTVTVFGVPAGSAAAPVTGAVSIDASRGYAGYCTSGGITVDVSVWSPDHHEVKRCAPEVASSDTSFDVLYKAGVVVDGAAHLSAAPAEAGWGYYSYTSTPVGVTDGTWTPMTSAALAQQHPSTPYLRWWFDTGQSGFNEPFPVPSTQQFYVGLSNADPAGGSTEKIWVTQTLPLEQVTVRVDGQVISPAGFQTDIDGVTPTLSYPVPAGTSGTITVTATGAYPGRTGTASFDVGGIPAHIVANPDPAIVSVWSPCQQGTGVTEIVDFNALGNHDVEVSCALFLPGETLKDVSGLKAMERAGFGDSGTRQYGQEFVCRLQNTDGVEQPTAAQFSCGGTPGGASYWSYWHASPSGTWGYSGSGAIGEAGEVEGWSFSTSAGDTIAPRIQPQDASGYHPVAATTPNPNPSSTAALTLAQSYLLSQVSNQYNGNDGGSIPPGLWNIGPAWGYLITLGETGATRSDLRQFLANYNTPGEWPVPDATTGTFDYENDAIDAFWYLLCITYAGGTPAEPGGAALVAAAKKIFDPDTGRFTVVDGIASEPSYFQSQALQYSAQLGYPVPAKAVDYLLSLQTSDGRFEDTPGQLGTDGADLQETLLAVDALGALRTAHDYGSGGAAALSAALTKAGTYLAGLQHADGSFAHNDAIDSVNLTLHSATSQVATTAMAATALAVTGQSAAAAHAARWTTGFQLSAALASPKAVSAVGSVADSAEGLAQTAVTDPANYCNGPTAGADCLPTASPYLTPLVAQALAAAPYQDPVPAQLVAQTATAITASSATIDIAVRPGTSPAAVTISYTATGGTAETTAAQHLTAVTDPSGAAPATLTYQLIGLTPGTTYSYRALLTTGTGSPTAGAAQTFATLAASPATDRTPNLNTAVHYLVTTQTANGLQTGTSLQNDGYYESFPSYADFGLSIDGAFALAATGDDDATLRKIVSVFNSNTEIPGGNSPDSWTGIGTAWASGGAVAKEALLAEVTGYDPRSFGGHDLIAALHALTCTAADTGTGCAGAGNFVYATSVFSQALGIMSLSRAGEPVSAPTAYLLGLQNADGSFPSLIPSSKDEDVDSTVMAAMALDLVAGNSAAVAKAQAWIASTQASDGSFPGVGPDSTNSTALAIQGLSLETPAYSSDISRAVAFIATQQNPDGGFTVSPSYPGTSDVRASTQVVSGVGGVSFGTLSREVFAGAASPTASPTPSPTPTPTASPAPGSTSTPAPSTTPAPSVVVIDAITDAAGNVVTAGSSLSFGTTYTVSEGGFTPNETVGAVVRSTPITLASTHAGSSGTVTYSFSVPTGLEAGSHTLTLTGSVSGHSAVFAFTVASGSAMSAAALRNTRSGIDAQSLSRSSGSLASTGVRVQALLTLAVALLAFGAMVLLARRRRTVLEERN